MARGQLAPLSGEKKRLLDDSPSERDSRALLVVVFTIRTTPRAERGPLGAGYWRWYVTELIVSTPFLGGSVTMSGS